MQAYSDPSRADEATSLPDIEVFELTARETAEQDEDTMWDYFKRPEFRLARMNSSVYERMVETMIAEQGINGGWYWQACFPGCLPDGDPIGPFPTSGEALADAQDGQE